MHDSRGKGGEVTVDDVLSLEEALLDKLSGIQDPSARKKCALDSVRGIFEQVLPESLIELVAAHLIPGDTGTSVDVRPEWLDTNVFHRGQKFALDNHFGIAYAHLLSLFCAFSFDESLKPLIATGWSSTPYTAFKRYLSTNFRIHNWCTSDPWLPGTPAHEDIKAVRKMHALVRKRMAEMDEDEAKRKTTIREPWCPSLEAARQDLQTSRPAAVGQCPYTVFFKLPNYRRMHLNQSEMAGTQFAFVGLVLLHPEFFGIHSATEEDLQGFCHVWRCVGYLLGIDDDINFCRGSLDDVRGRSRDFLGHWVKPNTREIKPELEHMMRCVLEGLQYYAPGPYSYETSLLDFARCMNLDMPELYKSMSYLAWIRHSVMRFYFDQASKISSLRRLMNRALIRAMEKAKNFDEIQHRVLRARSDETLASYVVRIR